MTLRLIRLRLELVAKRPMLEPYAGFFRPVPARGNPFSEGRA